MTPTVALARSLPADTRAIRPARGTDAIAIATAMKRRAVAIAGCLLALVPGTAGARDTGHLLRAADVVEEMRRDGTVADIVFAFGAAAQAQGTVVVVEGHARPYGSHGEPLPDDEQTCRKALRDALAQLARSARNDRKSAVAGIVSDSFGREYDGGPQVECHSGTTHSTIALKATLVDAAPAVPMPSNPTVAAFADLPFVNPTPAAHGRVPPASTGFAAADDVEAVPLPAVQRDRYREYLAQRTPKAFAIDEQGNARSVDHARDAMVRVLDRCAQEHVRCWLYAVDDRIVWSADVERRIGLSSQLQDDRLLKPTMTPVATRPRSRP
jgi:hypothetical protein